VDLATDDPDQTLDELLRERLGGRLEVGRGVELGPFKLRIREIADGKVQSVGLLIRATEVPPVEPEDG
jgi:NhaP-type Na+/H+ and K+/H+ antiporter